MEKLIVCGAAQGSVLGPLLFLIYINDLLKLKLNSIARLFADDAAFVYQAKDYESLQNQMREDLVTIESYLQSINLEMSVNKTVFMIFLSNLANNQEIFTEITFNGKKIMKVKQFKYLGLTIDEKLNWKDHVESISSKISPYIGLLRRIRPYINNKVAMQLYYAYVHSRFVYCLPIWASCSADSKNKLQRLQNKVIKSIRWLPRLTPTDKLYNNKLLSFKQLCDYESVLFIFKINQGLVRCDVDLIPNQCFTNRKTRQSDLIRIPPFSTTRAQSSLFYRGVNIFNQLKSKNLINNVRGISDLKSRLKIYFSKPSL